MWLVGSTPRTVNTKPTITMPKLKVCWVARAVFSAAERFDQGTCPSSLKGVTALLLEEDSGLEVA